MKCFSPHALEVHEKEATLGSKVAFNVSMDVVESDFGLKLWFKFLVTKS